jgi:hypothetical protein
MRSWAGPHDVRMTVLVNNVDNPTATHDRLAALAARGVVDRAVAVAQHLDRACAATGTRPRHFGRYLHWSDAPLVALSLDGPDLVLYWDPGADLVPGSADWVGPSSELLLARDDVLVANPRWADEATVLTEVDRRDLPFGLGYGFSDQVFLMRRSRAPRRLRRLLPYWLRSPVSARYPFTGATAFELLMDVHMRTSRLLRATHLGAEYRHVGTGHAYLPEGLRERVAFRRDREIGNILDRHRWRSPRLRRPGLLDEQPDAGR